MAPVGVDASGPVLVGRSMDEPEARPIAGGLAVVYSARSPDKTTDNEDAAGLFDLGQGRAVLAVADGMGGQAGGGSASRIALECVARALQRPLEEPESYRAAILDAVEQANREILELKLGAGTTLAAVEIDARGLRSYHAGDSEIVVVGQRGKVKLQTVSHSPVGYAVEAGLLDAQEALHHDERHLISNVIGAADMRIEVGTPLRLARRDTVLLGTDGLFDNLTPAEIVEVIRSGRLERAAATLVERCRERMRAGDASPSKPDDCTFVLFRSGSQA